MNKRSKKKTVKPEETEKQSAVDGTPEESASEVPEKADEAIDDSAQETSEETVEDAESASDRTPEEPASEEPPVPENPEEPGEELDEEPENESKAAFDFADPHREPTGKLVEIKVWKNQHGTQRLDDPDLKNYSDNGLPCIVVGDEAGTVEGQMLPLIKDDYARERSRKEVVHGSKVLLVPRILKQARTSGLIVECREATDAAT